jgi:hypothetical protein
VLRDSITAKWRKFDIWVDGDGVFRLIYHLCTWDKRWFSWNVFSGAFSEILMLCRNLLGKWVWIVIQNVVKEFRLCYFDGEGKLWEISIIFDWQKLKALGRAFINNFFDFLKFHFKFKCFKSSAKFCKAFLWPFLFWEGFSLKN